MEPELPDPPTKYYNLAGKYLPRNNNSDKKTSKKFINYILNEIKFLESLNKNLKQQNNLEETINNSQ